MTAEQFSPSFMEGLPQARSALAYARELHRGGLVASMTEDASIGEFSERKAALRRQIAAAGPDATSIYAADKVAKVRELRARLAAQPDLLKARRRDRERLEHYLQSLITLEQITPDHPLVRQLRFELEALSALPPDDIETEVSVTAPKG